MARTCTAGICLLRDLEIPPNNISDSELQAGAGSGVKRSFPRQLRLFSRPPTLPGEVDIDRRTLPRPCKSSLRLLAGRAPARSRAGRMRGAGRCPHPVENLAISRRSPEGGLWTLVEEVPRMRHDNVETLAQDAPAVVGPNQACRKRAPFPSHFQHVYGGARKGTRAA